MPRPPLWFVRSHAITAARLPAGAWKSTARQEACRLRRPVPAMTAPRRKVETIRTGPNLARIWFSVLWIDPGRQNDDQGESARDETQRV